MVCFTMRVAGCKVSVTANFDSTRAFCAEYLDQGDADFAVSISQTDLQHEREISIRQDQLEGIPARQFSDAYLETIALHRKIAEQLFAYNTLMFHGSVIAVDGAAYLFAAKSGTGKSTHTRLWRQLLGDRAVMVNDDKPMLRLENGQVLAYGTPWNGKHRLSTDICVPLKAFCILERGEENHIEQIPVKDALVPLLQQSNRPEDPAQMPKYMELIDGLARGVTFYRLSCNMKPEAAEVSYKAMAGIE